MPLASGLASQFGYAEESVYGTYTAPDHFLEFLKEGLMLKRMRIDSKALRAGRRTLGRWAPGVQQVEGLFELELPSRGIGLLLKHAFGAASISGTADRTVTDMVTNGTTTITSATAAFTSGDVGKAVTGTTIPAFTTIASVTNATTAVLSKAATGSGSNGTLNIFKSPYTWNFSPGDLSGLGLTAQVMKPDIAGVQRVHSYTGCKVDHWDISVKPNEFVHGNFALYGQNEDLSQALAAASYAAGYTPHTFAAVSATLGGVPVGLKDFTVSGDNKIAKSRWLLQGTNPQRPAQPLESGERVFKGTIKCDYNDLVQYNHFINGDEVPIVVTVNTGSTSQLVLTMNARYDGDTPLVTGPNLLEQVIPFVVESTVSDATAITAAYTTSEATP